MSQTSTYLNQQLYDQFNNALGRADASNGTGDQYINQFMQAYKNLTGKDATIEQIAPFIQNAGISAAGLPGNLGYGDLSSLANNYIQQTFPDQVSGYAQQQQTDQLGKTQQTIQDLISKNSAITAADLTNPNSPTYQSFSGLMNNMGITPSSGAFQAGMGGVLGQNAANTANAALTGVSLPTLSGIQGLSGYGLQQAQGNSNLGHMNDLGDFGLQAQLGKFLQEQSQPSGFEKNLGYANTSSNIVSNLSNAASNAKGGGKGLTWVCTAMRKAGAMTDEEVKTLHDYLFPTFWKRPFKFLGYFILGKILVGLAESVGTDWRVWKPSFYDYVMREPDPLKALSLYEQAFWDLFNAVRYRLMLRRVGYGTR